MQLSQLTRDQILALPAGRELDCLVMERVYGCEPLAPGDVRFRPTPDMVERFRQHQPDVESVNFISAPYFSTQLPAAWALVERLATKPRSFHIWRDNGYGAAPEWEVEIVAGATKWHAWTNPGETEGNALALAISRCALLTTLDVARGTRAD